MRTRTLGKSEVRLSEIALGTWGLATESYGPVDLARFEATVARALEVGVNTIDMAPRWGNAEEVVARMVGTRRDDVNYITRTHGIALHELAVSCDASLRHLATDRIDVFLLNHPSASLLAHETTARGMESLKSAGKIRAWGVSTSTIGVARAALTLGADALCVPHNLLASDLLMDLAPDIATRQPGVLVRSPLAYGLLADGWKRGHVFTENDHRVRRWSAEGLNERLRHIEALRFLVHGRNASLADAAIKYVLADPAVSTCVLGARSPAQIQSAALLGQGPPYLDEDDLIRIPQVLATMGI